MGNKVRKKINYTKRIQWIQRAEKKQAKNKRKNQAKNKHKTQLEPQHQTQLEIAKQLDSTSNPPPSPPPFHLFESFKSFELTKHVKKRQIGPSIQPTKIESEPNPIAPTDVNYSSCSIL